MQGDELMNDVLAFLLSGLRVTTELEVESLDVYRDSHLVVNQVQGDFLAKISKWWHIWMR